MLNGIFAEVDADGTNYIRSAVILGATATTVLDNGGGLVFMTPVVTDLATSLGENRGTATIANGNTSIAVTHNLFGTPDASDIVLTPLENPTNPPGHIWVSAVGATTFTINCAADPGASGLDIAWKARM
jgi:hypothetical protein